VFQFLNFFLFWTLVQITNSISFLKYAIYFEKLFNLWICS
jgi:hypothetical protein